MRIEALCTGDELLTGVTTDTNSTWFQQRLLEHGEQIARTTVVGDVREEILEALRTLSGRADAVLVSGGLGPTADDLTAEVAAQAAGVPLVIHEGALAALRERFAKRGLAITENNMKQVMVPAGSEVVLNPAGSAPMFILRLGKAVLFFVPGVPREYRALVETAVLPRIDALRAERGETGFRALRLLKTVFLPESHLDARVRPLLALHPRVTFGFRTHFPENHLKLMAEGRSPEEAREVLEAADAAARPLLGDHLFGVDDETMAGVVGRQLLSRRETLALAESCTGGRIGDMLTDVPGASAYFLGSAVAYANDLKERWVSVAHTTLVENGAVSQMVAGEMARGARRSAESTWALSVTGIAGPDGGTPEKPVGTVFIGLDGPDGTEVHAHRFHGDREWVRSASAYAALDWLRLRTRGSAS
ncbi:MAG: CinA family nicotinamide mononucleotide deamidase-related protein [Myxococcaceae bacterium]|nr:MAG: CinA family nicotinamide mononucleotide deamidase-related protein [Myxococcaceae bacterium]